MIWQFTFLPRVVELLASEHCTGGFYSQAELPVALHVCKESRVEAEIFYQVRFGSFLQAEKTYFNYSIDTLYLDIALEEDCLHRLFGILKQDELSSLKYVAIDEAYLDGQDPDLVIDPNSTRAGLWKALKAMKGLKEVVIVREIENDSGPGNHGGPPKVQIKFCNRNELGRIDEDWVATAGELPDAAEELRGWKLKRSVQKTAVYGWRTL